MEGAQPLSGRTVLVTGASRGIGRATAVHLAREGADVVVHFNRMGDLAEETASEVRNAGRQALVVQADLESAEAVEGLFSEIRDEVGHLDGLVANAAATAFKRVTDLKPHHLERTFALVVKALVRMVQLALPLMEGRDGRIVTVSGHGTPFTLPHYAALGTAKGAVETFTRYVAAECAPSGVTANCVSPGVIDTDSARFYMGEGYDRFRERVAGATPMGRMGTPQDVAAVIGFLVSPASRFITGQVITVDGGLSLVSPPFLPEE